MKQCEFYTLVVGAGPAGLAAALSAAQSGRSVCLLDDNPLPGGQIWRHSALNPPPTQAKPWFVEMQSAVITTIYSARVLASLDAQALIVETPHEALEIHYKRLILATGARERFLPFPGWTLPGVTGAGGLQALVKGGLPVQGKRIVVAGSGPLLLAVAAYLKSKGAEICAIAEQAPWSKLAAFGLQMPLHMKQSKQAADLARQLLGVSYHADCWVTRAHGTEKLKAVTLTGAHKTWAVPCDYLACGFGLVPNSELAMMLGCTTVDGTVQVDEWQHSSHEHVYCAGEITGIGGLDAALLEGRIAGYAASGQTEKARAYFPARQQARRFAALLERTFQLRAELKVLADARTIVCRCEDVAYQEIKPHTSWRSAKLHTRCGMGPCQGRVCGSATDFLFGWTQDSIRVPVSPASVSSLIAYSHKNNQTTPEENVQ